MADKNSDSNTELPISLDQISIKTPCRMDWDLMASVDDSGADRIRFCRRCEKNVYNLAAMDEMEAIELLHRNEPVCARIFRRPDGTIVTSACPSPTPLDMPRGRKRFQFSLAALMVLTTASAGLAASAPWIGDKIRPLWERISQKFQKPPIAAPVMGEMVAPPPAVVNGPWLEEMGDVCFAPELEEEIEIGRQ